MKDAELQKWGNYICKVLQDRKIPAQDIEDIKQEVLIHLHKYPFDGSKHKLRNVILKVIRQCIWQYVEKKKKDKAIYMSPLYENNGIEENPYETLPAAIENAGLVDQEKGEMLAKLEECIKTLSEDQKKLLNFLLHEGTSYSEHKEKYNTLTKHEYYRAKRKLKRIVDDYLNEDDNVEN